MIGLRLAIAFLTRVPLSVPNLAPGDWGRAARWFPLAGAVVAFAGLIAQFAGSVVLSPLVGATFAVATMVWITGALHIDGFSDCLDGWGVNGDRDRRLAVMHDPRAGAVGAAGTALLLVSKVALLAACVDAGTAAPAIFLACVFARTFLPLEMAFAPPATPGVGLVGRLANEVRPGDAGLGVLLAFLLCSPALVLFPAVLPGALAGIALAGAATLAWHAAWRERIGGITGDVLGAAVELREVVLLAAMGASLHG